MKMPHAIFGSALVIALAIIVASLNPAESQRRAEGFMVANGGTQLVWRVNTTTGSVSYCARTDNSPDRKLIASRTPFCSKGSPPVNPNP